MCAIVLGFTEVCWQVRGENQDCKFELQSPVRRVGLWAGLQAQRAFVECFLQARRVFPVLAIQVGIGETC